MKLMKYVMGQEQGEWRGYLEDHPDHTTHGQSFEDLQPKLSRMHCDLTSGKVHGAQQFPRAA